MKILYIIHEFYPECHGGTEKFIFNIAKSMIKFGHDVKVITYSHYNDSFYNKVNDNVLIKEFKYKDISVIALKLVRSDELIDYTLENEILEETSEKIIKTENPDLIHFGHIMRMGEFVKAAIKLEIPYIMTLTDFFVICPKYFLFTDNIQLCAGPVKGTLCSERCSILKFSTISRFDVAKKFLFNAKRIISPSDFLAEIFRSEFGNLNIKVINHGIDKSRIKENLKIYKKNDKIVFGFFGGHAFIKGGHIIIEAINNIKNFEDSKLKIYGFEKDEIYNIMLNMRKIDNVEICGVFSEEALGDIFKEIDVVIIPSLCYESYSLILHEAFASNIPVIVSDQGALNEKVLDGVNGFKFDRGNYIQLGEIMNDIIKNPDVLNKLKNNIKLNYIPSIENEARAYETEYSKCMNYQVLLDAKKSKTININRNWAELYYRNIYSNSGFNIKEDTWHNCVSIIFSNFTNIKEELLYIMRLRLEYLRLKFKNKTVNYIIWGASNSGMITKELIKLCLPNFNLLGFVDKNKIGTFDKIEIFKPDCIKNLNFEYMFIATTPGKDQVVEIALDLNMKMLDEFIFGYGVI